MPFIEGGAAAELVGVSVSNHRSPTQSRIPAVGGRSWPETGDPLRATAATRPSNLQRPTLYYSYTPTPPHSLLRPAIPAERSRGGPVKDRRLSRRRRWERRAVHDSLASCYVDTFLV
jgi:hypothetical protein